METEDRDRQQQLQLLQQLVELQRENIVLRRNGSNKARATKGMVYARRPQTDTCPRQ